MARKSSKKDQREQKFRGKSRRKQNKVLIWLALLIAVGGGAGWMVWSRANLPGQEFDSMGQLHIPQGTPAPKYNSSPPTSGPHAGATRWGEHNSEVLEINQVHNLEHGGVLIQYNCQRLPAGMSCGDVRDALYPIFRDARNDVGHKIILAPYEKMPHSIAVTSWTWMQAFDTPDRTGILAFADSHYNNSPENVP